MRVPKEKHSVSKMESTPCMESAPLEHSELAVAGSAVSPADIHRYTSTTSTQELSQSHYEQGTGQHKVIAEESLPESQFLHRGRAAFMEDQPAALMMLEKAMPVIHSGKGKFAFLYTKDLDVQHSCFERNSNFRLQLQRHCGKGGSAEVSAFLDENEFSFVRKRMGVEYFRKEEVEVMLKLDHPGVCKVLAVLCHGRTIDLLLQDAGYPLKQVLQTFSKKGMTDQQYQKVMEDLGRQGFEILRYIHQQGVCHLDIKPENLLVRLRKQGGLVLVLVDFGSSRYVGNIIMPDDRTTPEYWPPEIWHFFTRHQSQKCWATSMLRQESELVTLPQKEANKLIAAPEIDTAAMGMVLYFIGTQQHFILAERGFPEKAVPSEEVEMLCQKPCNNLQTRHAFNLLLMTKYSDCVPNLTTRGRWVCSSIPNSVQEVIRGTLKPDPKQRMKDEQAVSILSCQSGTVACEEKDDPAIDIPVNKRETCSPVTPEPNKHFGGKVSQHRGCQPSQNKLLNPVDDAVVDTDWKQEFSTISTQELTAAKPSTLEPLTSEHPSMEPLSAKPPSVEPLASKPLSEKPLAAEPQASGYLASDRWQPSHLNQLLAPFLAVWDTNIRATPHLASHSLGASTRTLVNTPICMPVSASAHMPVNRSLNTTIHAPVHLATPAQTSMLQNNITLRTDSPHAATCVTQQGESQKLHLDDQNQAQGQQFYNDDHCLNQDNQDDQHQGQGHLDDQGKGQRLHLDNRVVGQWSAMEGETEGDTSIDYDVELDDAIVVEAQHSGVLDTQHLALAQDPQNKVKGLRPGNPHNTFQAFSPQADITNNLNALSLQPSPDLPTTHPLPLHLARPKGNGGGDGRPVLKTGRRMVRKPMDQSPPLKSSRKRSLESTRHNDYPTPKVLFTVASSGRQKPRVHTLQVPPSFLPSSYSPLPPSSSPVQPETEDTSASVTCRWQPDMVASGLLLGQQAAGSYGTCAVSKLDAAAAVPKHYPKKTAGSRYLPNSVITHPSPTSTALHCSDIYTGMPGRMDQAVLLELNQLLEENHFFEAVGPQLRLEEQNLDQPAVTQVMESVQGCADQPHASQVWAETLFPTQESTKPDPPRLIQEWVGPDLGQVHAEPEPLCLWKEKMEPDPPFPSKEWMVPDAPHPTHALAESDDLLLPGCMQNQEQGQLEVHGEEANLPNFDMIID